MADEGGDGDVVITEESYGDRLQDSCGLFCISPIFFIGAVVLLFWNEGNYIGELKSLRQAESVVVEASNITMVDPSLEGKLVHLTGTVLANLDLGDDKVEKNSSSIETAVDDPLFGFAPPKALKLRRSVEMFQWIEHKQKTKVKTAGGKKITKTTYSYTKGWNNQVIDSKVFHNPDHQNPGELPFRSEEWVAEDITLGAYSLSDQTLEELDWFVPPKAKASIDNIPSSSLRANMTAIGSGFYKGNPSEPKIGDIKITYKVVPEQTVSIIAKQTGNLLGSFKTDSGRTVLLVDQGKKTSTDMILQAQGTAKLVVWLLRLAGWALMFISLQMVVGPLSTVLDIIPFVGDFVGGVLGVVSGVVSLFISIFVIAIAWLFYRPYISIPILAVLIGGYVFIAYQKQQSRKASYEEVPETDIVV